MKSLLDIYNRSFSAFEQWNLTEFTVRKEKLVRISAQLPEVHQNVLNYHLTHAESSIAPQLSLVSPTGETNELYTQGRGVSILLLDADEPNSQLAFMAMVTALLIAGNSVIICSSCPWVKEAISAYQNQQLFPDGLVCLTPKGDYHKLMTLDIRNFVFIGESSETPQINETLSLRPNAITSLVAETDFGALPQSKDPMLALRFITEKVRSINITAIGGNASLLELGNTTH